MGVIADSGRTEPLIARICHSLVPALSKHNPNSINAFVILPYHLMFPADEAGGFKSKVESQKEEHMGIGVPEEWVDPLKALGYDSVDKIKALEKPGKLHQEMMGYRKKNKLEISTVTMEQVSEWIS